MSARRSPWIDFRARQKRCVDYIADFQRVHPRGPSLGEIAVHLGFSRTAASHIVDGLVRCGVITRGRKRATYRVGELQIVHDQSFQAEARQ